MSQVFRTTPRPTLRRHRRHAAFTLIEILIVVVILGILAAIVVPQFTNASTMTRENSLKDDLRYIRSQIVVFRAHHRDVSPGYPGGISTATPTSDDFVSQLTRFSDEYCSTSAGQTTIFRFWPY